jgi:putative hydrolase of the HAD superfamily
MNLPKAILLDLDDTILDSYSDPDAVWLQLCNEFADRLDNVTPDMLFSALGESREWFWKDSERARQGRLDLIKARREIVSAAFVHLGFQSSSIVNEMADRYTTIREKGVRPFPNAVETLVQLREAGTNLALITNGSAEMQRSKIERFDLAKHFDHVQVEGEFGIGKPDERAFWHALEILGVAASEAWMVGDNLEWDIQGAQQVGIHAIWVDLNGRGLPDTTQIQPDRIIGTLSDLID